jgi:hypothetical protein
MKLLGNDEQSTEKKINHLFFKNLFINIFFILFQPHGAQLIPAHQFVQQQSQQQQAAVAAQQQQQQQQKRSAVADPKTGIPMAAYPLTAFSYPSPSPLPIQFQQPYLTAVPMACKLFDHFYSA